MKPGLPPIAESETVWASGIGCPGCRRNLMSSDHWLWCVECDHHASRSAYLDA